MESLSFFLKRMFYYFNKITSQHGTNWILAIIWVLVFELISSSFEYYYLDVSSKYVYYIPNNFFKELFIALTIVVFIWLCVYNIIFMKKNPFFFLIVYICLGTYLLITKDVTFNLLVNNIINPFKLEFSTKIYVFIQILIKIINTYLLYMTFISIRNSRKN